MGDQMPHSPCTWKDYASPARRMAAASPHWHYSVPITQTLGASVKVTRSVAAAAVVGLWFCTTPTQAAQSPSVRDLARLVRLSDPQLSPDARRLR